MRKWLMAIALMLGCLLGKPFEADAQANSFFTDRAVGVFPLPGRGGQTGLVPIQYGPVRVCNFPAVGSPCTNPANITDINGNPLSIVGGNFGQITTDVVGRFSFGCAPGLYQVQVAASGSNIPQLNYPITCGMTTIAGNNILGGNNTFTGTNIFNAAVTFLANITDINETLSGLLTAATIKAGTINNSYNFCNGPFSAHCDGVTDDSAAWNSAMSTCATNNGMHLTMPTTPRKVFFSGAITTGSCTDLILDCESGWADNEPGSGGPNSPTCHLIWASGVSGLTTAIGVSSGMYITNISFESQDTVANSDVGVHIQGMRTHFERNKVTKFGGPCLLLDSTGASANPNFLKIIDNLLISCFGDGAKWTPGTNENLNVEIVMGNSAIANGAWGYEVTGVNTSQLVFTSVFLGNHASANTSGAYLLSGLSSTLFAMNYAEGDGHGNSTLGANADHDFIINPRFGGPTWTDNSSAGSNTFFDQSNNAAPNWTNQVCIGPKIGVAGKVYCFRSGIFNTNDLDVINLTDGTGWVDLNNGFLSIETLKPLMMQQQAAPSFFAGFTFLWADSTANRLLMNNNNTGSDTVGDTLVQDCGATSTCSHTNLLKPQIVKGSAPLVSGTPSTVTITGISPAFTSSTSYVCTVSEATTATNNLLKVTNVSGSSFTVTGPNTLTDTINYICVGN